MFLRRTQTTSHGRRYEYIHLVESYRRQDGRPAHRVLANVTDWDPQALQNLETALQSSRLGRSVVVSSGPASLRKPPKVCANLRYLDIVVFQALWQQWGLDEIIGDCLNEVDANRLAADIVRALVLQRVVEPGSKLAATRWFPKTALPALSGIAAEQFNNTRVHRVLHDLEQATPMVMARLAERYRKRDGTFATLFMDATDTWFEGSGPPTAEYAKTKEGMIRQKIGIVLLCNERGYPLRWQVIPGRMNETRAMTDMLEALSGVSWVDKAPVVMDRAMGNTAHLRAIQATGLRFLTALVKTEWGNYAPTLPWETLSDLGSSPDEATTIRNATERIRQAGFHRTHDTLFYSDLGFVTYAGDTAPPADLSEPESRVAEDRTVLAMRFCREMTQLVADGRVDSLTAAGKALGLGTSGVVWKYLALRHLSQEIQEAVLQGQASSRTLIELQAIAKRPPEEQPEAFSELLLRPPSSTESRVRPAETKSVPQVPLCVRVVVYFNPERFTYQRAQAHRKSEELVHFVDNLNASLAQGRCHRKRENLIAHLDRRLRREQLLDAFQVDVFETVCGGHPRLQVRLIRNEANWQKRRRSDGFTILVAHPEIEHDAETLCQLYRDKDAVEKDFQVIKSALEIRPVRHHTDEKVRAHVTLCMLALLLERTLRDRLKGKYTVAQARERLDVRLNQFATSHNSVPLYGLTELQRDQRALLRLLKLAHLADDECIAEQIARHKAAP